VKAEFLLLPSCEISAPATAERQKDKLQTNSQHPDLSGSSVLDWNSDAFAHFT